MKYLSLILDKGSSSSYFNKIIKKSVDPCLSFDFLQLLNQHIRGYDDRYGFLWPLKLNRLQYLMNIFRIDYKKLVIICLFFKTTTH